MKIVNQMRFKQYCVKLLFLSNYILSTSFLYSPTLLLHYIFSPFCLSDTKKLTKPQTTKDIMFDAAIYKDFDDKNLITTNTQFLQTSLFDENKEKSFQLGIAFYEHLKTHINDKLQLFSAISHFLISYSPFPYYIWDVFQTISLIELIPEDFLYNIFLSKLTVNNSSSILEFVKNHKKNLISHDQCLIHPNSIIEHILVFDNDFELAARTMIDFFEDGYFFPLSFRFQNLLEENFTTNPLLYLHLLAKFTEAGKYNDILYHIFKDEIEIGQYLLDFSEFPLYIRENIILIISTYPLYPLLRSDFDVYANELINYIQFMVNEQTSYLKINPQLYFNIISILRELYYYLDETSIPFETHFELLHQVYHIGVEYDIQEEEEYEDEYEEEDYEDPIYTLFISVKRSNE